MTRTLSDAALGTGIAVESAGGWVLGFGAGRLLGPVRERGADLRKLRPAAAIGQEAVMANAHQTLGQDMQQKPAQELLAFELHHPVTVPVADGLLKSVYKTLKGGYCYLQRVG